MWKAASGEAEMSAEEGRQGIFHESSIWCGAGNSMAGEGAGSPPPFVNTTMNVMGQNVKR